jgi:hypothetical protein
VRNPFATTSLILHPSAGAAAANAAPAECNETALRKLFGTAENRGLIQNMHESTALWFNRDAGTK